jgi:hypothetical protein
VELLARPQPLPVGLRVVQAQLDPTQASPHGLAGPDEGRFSLDCSFQGPFLVAQRLAHPPQGLFQGAVVQAGSQVKRIVQLPFQASQNVAGWVNAGPGKRDDLIDTLGGVFKRQIQPVLWVGGQPGAQPLAERFDRVKRLFRQAFLGGVNGDPGRTKEKRGDQEHR